MKNAKTTDTEAPAVQWVIDTETLATTPDAVVVSIGGFAIRPGDKPADIATRALAGPGSTKGSFELLLDLGEQITAGRRVDPGTVKWWLTKVDTSSARSSLFGSPRISAAAAADHIITHLRNAERVWCRGTDFDIPLLDHLFDSVFPTTGGRAWSPWHFSAVRDLRTHHEIHLDLVGKAAAERVAQQVATLRESLPAHGAYPDAAVQAYEKTCWEWELDEELSSTLAQVRDISDHFHKNTWPVKPEKF